MIAGKSGLHAWTPPGAEEAAVTLNELRDEEGNNVWPRYRLRDIGGLKGLGDPEDNRSARVGGVGEIAERSERRGKSISYSGVIEAKTLRQLEEAADALRAAFADLNREGRMDVTWSPKNAEYEDEPAKFYEARALTCEVIEELQGKRYAWPFVIGLRAGDPRHFDSEATESVAEIKSTSTPVEFSDIDLPAVRSGPILEIEVPLGTVATGYLVRNTTTGKSLRLDVPKFFDGERLILDFQRRTIVDGDGVDRSSFLSEVDHGLWVPEPLVQGANAIEIERILPTAGAFDDFDQSSGALTGKEADVGGVYSSLTGSDSTDFEVSGGKVIREASQDGGSIGGLVGRAVGLSNVVPTGGIDDYEVGIDLGSLGEGGLPGKSAVGLLVEVLDDENFLMVYINWVNELAIVSVVGGEAKTLATETLETPWADGTRRMIVRVVSDQASVYVGDPDLRYGDLIAAAEAPGTTGRGVYLFCSIPKELESRAPTFDNLVAQPVSLPLVTKKATLKWHQAYF